MIPNKDQYVDKDDKLTDDPAKFAAQVAVAGVYLDDRVAKRYGIGDVLVSVNEPGAVRNVIGAGPEPAEKETEPEPKPLSIQTEADAKAAEPKAEKPKAEPAKKAEAKKGAKKK